MQESALFIVLSPAKKLDTSPAPANLPTSTPKFLSDIEELSVTTRKLSHSDLKRLMKISNNLAELNFSRFQDFSLPINDENSRPAIFSFAGDTYIGFDVGKLDTVDLSWSQDKLGVLSGFYGLLRPLDLMQPYRLEMGTRLSNRRGPDLYAFWGDQIGGRISELLKDDQDPTLVNLASNEYFKAVRAKKLGLRVVTPTFRDVKDGNSRTLGMFAKRARGAMARWAITHRIQHSDQLKMWSEDGYCFVPETSDEFTWIFERDQPPPAGSSDQRTRSS